MSDDILLTVWCLTYNHKKYVRQALQGIVSQKTGFKFNVYIFDDASTDGTSDIVREFAQKYDNVTAVIPKKNSHEKKHRRRFKNWLEKKYLVGKYVAWCELDDFWIDNNKLQIQVGFMEQHPEYSLTVHNAIRLNEQTGETIMLNCYGDSDREISASELIARKNGNVASCSMVFRKDAWFYDKDSIFGKCGIGDMPHQLNAILHGKVYYFSRIMSLYHYRASGAWTNMMANDVNLWINHCLNMMEFYSKYNLLTCGNYQDGCIDAIHRYYRWLSNRINKDNIETVLNHYKDTPQYGLVKRSVGRYCIVSDDDCLPEEIYEFINRNSLIFIYGIGEYGTKIGNKLKGRGIDFSGFIQTVKTSDVCCGKQVYGLDQMDNIEDYGIIIGVGDSYRNELSVILENKGIKNIYSPFWVGETMNQIYTLTLGEECRI